MRKGKGKREGHERYELHIELVERVIPKSANEIRILVEEGISKSANQIRNWWKEKFQKVRTK